MPVLLILISTYYSTKYLVIQVENYLLKLAKKWTLKTQKSQIAILVLNQCSISAIFPTVRFAGDQKTALSGESLYIKLQVYIVALICYMLTSIIDHQSMR